MTDLGVARVSFSSLTASATVPFASSGLEVKETFLPFISFILIDALDLGLKFFNSIVSFWDFLLRLPDSVNAFAPPNLKIKAK